MSNRNTVHIEGRYQIIAAIITVLGSILVIFIARQINSEPNENRSKFGLSFSNKVNCSCSDDNMYAKGLAYYLDMNYEDAYDAFKHSRENGCVEAIYFLGRMKLHGEGVPIDKVEAKSLFELAVNKGDDKANYGLGSLALENSDFKSNANSDNYFSKAVDAIEACANEGHTFWRTNFGYMSLYGHGVIKDVSKAKSLFLEPANNNYGRAQYMLGDIYYKEMAYKDIDLAINWYKKASDHFPRYGSPEFELGYLYSNESGYVDLDKSFRWYLKSANKGNSSSQHNIAIAYYYGKGVDQNYDKAYEWCTKAMEQGDNYAINLLGILYENGYGVTKNLDLAIDYYLKAANSGLEIAYSNLANIYIQKKKYKEAKKWLTLASEREQARAKYLLGYLYEQKEFSEHDYEKSFYWYSQAINDDNSYDAHHRLGLLYYNGNGIAKNIDKAVEYFNIAAQNNHALSQYSLGVMYISDRSDVENGMKWLRKAAASNVKDAKYYFSTITLAILDSSTSAEDIRLAESYLITLAAENYKEAKVKLAELRRKTSSSGISTKTVYN